MREHLATPPAVPPPTLDLGCGTGLMAVAVGDLVGPITGIDISPAMLGSARAKALYAELIEADLLDWLALETRQWPIIIAADVLIYFGALERVFALMHARLAPGGLFLFSLEEHLPVTDPAHANGTPPTDPGWQLGRMGRFGHSSAYIARALEAAGLAVCRIQPGGATPGSRGRRSRLVGGGAAASMMHTDAALALLHAGDTAGALDVLQSAPLIRWRRRAELRPSCNARHGPAGRRLRIGCACRLADGSVLGRGRTGHPAQPGACRNAGG